MGIFSRIRDSLTSAFSSVKETVSSVFDNIADRWAPNHEEPKDEGTQSKDDDILSDEDGSVTEGEQGDDDYDTGIGGIIWDWQPEDFGDISEGGDGKQYIEAEWEMYLYSGEVITGSIRFYGNEEDIYDAIIAMNGDVDSGDIAYIGIV